MEKFEGFKKIIVFTDGASRGNPGPGSLGLVICDDKGGEIKKYSQFLGKVTNNEAEYKAVIFALKKIKHLFGKENIKKIEIQLNSDSELLVNQLKGKYKVKNSNIGNLFLEIWNLRIDFGNIEFKSIPREENKEADRLANEALDQKNKSQKLF
jgi:ribonuclease HI